MYMEELAMKKVIIIGAGPAGLTAGLELLRKSKDYEVTILEASDAIGGISRTVNHNGNRMDLGGHRFFSKNEEVNEWWEALMPGQGAPAYDDRKLKRQCRTEINGPDPEFEDEVMLFRKRISRIYYNNKFFDYPIKMNSTTIKNMGFTTTMEAGFSYLGGSIAKRSESSLEDFYINRFGKKLYSMFFEGYTEKLWGRHPSKISADWGAQRVKGLSIPAIIKDVTNKAFNKKDAEVETSLIEEFAYPKYGPGQLWEKAADEIRKLGGEIKFNCKVTGVEARENTVNAVVCEVNGMSTKLYGDIFISSMSLKDLIMGMPFAPDFVTEVAKGLPYRDFVTIGLLVPRLKLVNTTDIKTINDQVPDCWIYVQDTKVKLGRIQIFNNWSPYLVKDPENTVWIGLEYFCDEGDYYWNLDEKAWVEMAVKELVSMGVIGNDTEILDHHKEQVVKAYPAYFDTYEKINVVVNYVNKFHNLYCVGRNGQHRYNNMDHSMITAFETVKNILNGITTKDNIWNVNTEAEYHEEKSEGGRVAETAKSQPAVAPSEVVLDASDPEIELEIEKDNSKPLAGGILKSFRRANYGSFSKRGPATGVNTALLDGSSAGTVGASGSRGSYQMPVGFADAFDNNKAQETEKPVSPSEPTVSVVGSAPVIKPLAEEPAALEPENNEPLFSGFDNVNDESGELKIVKEDQIIPKVEPVEKPEGGSFKVAKKPIVMPEEEHKAPNIVKKLEIGETKSRRLDFAPTIIKKQDKEAVPEIYNEPEVAVVGRPPKYSIMKKNSEINKIDYDLENTPEFVATVATNDSIWEEVAKSERNLQRAEERRKAEEKRKAEEEQARLEKEAEEARIRAEEEAEAARIAAEKKARDEAVAEAFKLSQIKVDPDIIAKGKVIKKTTITSTDPSLSRRKPKPKKETTTDEPSNEKVVAVIKDGVKKEIDNSQRSMRRPRTNNGSVRRRSDIKVNADGTTTTTPKRKPKTTVEKAKEKEAVAEAEAQNAVLENAVDTVQTVDTNPVADVVQTTESNE